jgi:hypothetical protein
LPNQRVPSLEGALPDLGSMNFEAALGSTGTRSRHATTIFFQSVPSSGKATS